MNRWNILMCIASVLFFSDCAGTKMKEAPVTLTWEKGMNEIEPGFYDNSFLIKNVSDKPLENNWVIYYSQFSRQIKQPENTPVKIEAVNVNYFKMYPTSFYRPLQGKDSLRISFSCTNRLIKTAQSPEGAYLIIDAKGKKSDPIPVDLKKMPFNNVSLESSADKKEQAYSDGLLRYEQNQRFEVPVSLLSTDILPAIKNVIRCEGQSVISENVKLKYNKSYSAEAKLLTNKLKQFCGIETGNKGTTKISIDTLPKDVVPVNEEYYQLDIRNNEIAIKGNSAHAVFNGIQTLLALLREKTFPCKVENLSVTDYPDLPYRGLMLDVARNFTAKENLKKLIDALSFYKINVLHLHLSDDEGWRLEIPGLEELTSVGGRRGHTENEQICLYPAFDGCFDPNNRTSLSSGYYTKNDFIALLRFAASRHVQVILEIESPGHARAAIVAMKARYRKYEQSDKSKALEYLLSDPEDKSVYTSAQSFTDNVMNVALPSTYRFFEKVVKEISGMYREAGVPLVTVHVGGDEVPDGAWMGSPQCQNLMKEHHLSQKQDLEEYFFKRISLMLQNQGLKMSGWQEIALNHSAETDSFFCRNIAGVYCWNTNPEWKRDEIPYVLANKGYNVVLCNVNNFYLDLAYNNHPDEPGLYWGGFVDEQKSFATQPFSVYRSVRTDRSGKPVNTILAEKGKVELTPDGKKRITGIQAELFSETLRNFNMVEYYIFPKILGLVERGWNVEPAWASLGDDSEPATYEKALIRFNAQITQKEMPYFQKAGMNFRLSQPGIYVKDGWLYANSSVKDAEIRYTTDNSEPTLQSALWQNKVPCDATTVKAKLFYLGKQSVTTIWREE